MKKFLLFAAAFAALSMSAQDYTFEKVWEVTEGLPTNSDSRQGICLDGKYYINVKGENPKVMVFGEGGLTDEEWPGGTNCGITRDEAGNLVISLASFPGSWVCDGQTPMIRVINPKTGASKEYAIPATAILKQRCDFLGLAVGDLMTNGKLYLTSSNGKSGDELIQNDGVVILSIEDGAVNPDNCYEATVDSPVTPSTATVINNIDGERLFYVTRNAAPTILTPDGDNFTAETFTLPNKGASCGAQMFEFDGKELVVYPTLPNYKDGFAIAEPNAEEPMFTIEETGKTAYAQCNWVNVEMVNGDAYIYQYLPGLFIACYKLSAGGAEEHTYAVCGAPAALFAMENDWDPVAAPEMQLNDNGLYEWISAETELEAGTIEFKIVEDHAWDVCYPASDESGYNNYTVTVEEAGKYVLTVYFNPETKEITHELVKTEVPPVEPAKVFILGEVNGNTWAPNVGVEMETEDNKVFTKEVTLVRPENRDGQKYCFFSFATKLMEAADDWDGLAPYRFGAVSNGDFLFEPDMMGQPLALTAENGQAFQVPEGEYTLTVDLENMTLTIEGTIYSGIEYINTVNVKNVRFYNLQGMESTTPFQGVNIVVSEMTDGSKVITKVVK